MKPADVHSSENRHPLQNRVLPDGRIVSMTARGSMLGNRGGEIHDPNTRTLLKRRWASKRWISCQLEFKNRRRTVMGNSYTELFFLDEVVALAAGHRPCFECRRKAANSFSKCWIEAHGRPAESMADGMDNVLHLERTKSERSEISFDIMARLPIAAMVQQGEEMFARGGNGWLQYSPQGYMRADLKDELPIKLLTPMPIVSVLANGYEPEWHFSFQE